MDEERTNPYVGPVSFKEEDKDYFFGRDTETEALLSLVLTHRLVLFYATSGAGKSSLINVKLIPRLRQAAFTPMRGRIGGAQRHLDGLDEANNVYAYALLANMRVDLPASKLWHLSLSDYLSRYQQLEQSPDDESLWLEPARILIIDQFEELLTSYQEFWSQRESFIQQIRVALDTDPMLWVLLVMREDYVTTFDTFAYLLPDKLRVRYHMEKMREDAALLAITEPAKVMGVNYKAAVAKEFLNDLRQVNVPGREQTMAGEFIEPVQLQLVCHSLWERIQPEPGKTINDKDIAVADVNRSLADYYNRSVTGSVAATGVGESVLREWFDNKLITAVETRGQVLRVEDETEGIDNAVVEFLSTEFFLLRRFAARGATWYELVHDRFIQPILSANRKWRSRQPLLRLALEWESADFSEDLLLRDHQLDRHLQPNWETLGPTVVNFVKESETFQKKQLKKAEDRRKKMKIYVSFIGIIITVVVFITILILSIKASKANAIAEAEATRANQLAIEGTSVATLANHLAIEGTSEAIRANLLAIEGTLEAARANLLAIEGTSEANRANLLAIEAAAEADRANLLVIEAQTAQAAQIAGIETRIAQDEAEEATAIAQALATPTPSPSATRSGSTPAATATPTTSATPLPNFEQTREFNEAQLKTVQAQQTAVACLSGRVEILPMTSPVVDGDLQEWWEEPTAVSCYLVYSRTDWDQSDDITANWFLGWDKDNLYVAVAVTDDLHVQEATGAKGYLGDSVELQIDTDRAGDFAAGLSQDDFQILLSPGNFARLPPYAFRFRGAEDGTLPGYLGHQIVVAARRTEDGYALEAAIPWSDLETKPKEGKVLGISLNVNDNDRSGEAVQVVMKSHVSTRTLTDPTGWGEAILR